MDDNLNTAIAQAVAETIRDVSVYRMRNMDGIERVMFIDDGIAWIITVEPMMLP